MTSTTTTITTHTRNNNNNNTNHNQTHTTLTTINKDLRQPQQQLMNNNIDRIKNHDMDRYRTNITQKQMITTEKQYNKLDHNKNNTQNTTLTTPTT